MKLITRDAIINILRDHKEAFCLAILVGLIVVFPQAYFRYDNQGIYQGIDMISPHEETFYTSRVQEAREGHFNLSGTLFKEGKQDPYLQPPLGEILVASAGRMFFLDLNNTILLARFIFPFLAFLAAYAFVFLISKEKLIALAASTTIFLADIFFNREVFLSIFKLLQGRIPSLPMDFLQLYRPVHPQVSSFFFFLFLFFFWLFYEKKEWRFGILSAFVLGLSFYIYSYLWTFLLTFWIIVLSILFFQKRWILFKKMIITLLLGSLLILPLFLNYYHILSHPNGNDLFERLVLNEIPREPHFSLSMILLLVAFLIFFPQNWKKRYYFLLASLLVPFILYNQQLITGRNLQVAHYWRYYRLPLAIIMFVILFFSHFSLNEKLKRFKKPLPFLIIGTSVLIGISIQFSSYIAHKTDILSFQRYAPLLEYLNRDIPPEAVIFSDLNLSSFIPTYTKLNVFSHDIPDYLAVSKERLIETYFLYRRLEGLKEEDALETFSGNKKEVSRRIFGNTVIPNETLHSLSQKYGQFIQISLDGVLKKYGVNYVVWDAKNFPSWSLEGYQFLEKVYQEEEFKIFKVL